MYVTGYVLLVSNVVCEHQFRIFIFKFDHFKCRIIYIITDVNLKEIIEKCANIERKITLRL